MRHVKDISIKPGKQNEWHPGPLPHNLNHRDSLDKSYHIQPNKLFLPFISLTIMYNRPIQNQFLM